VVNAYPCDDLPVATGYSIYEIHQFAFTQGDILWKNHNTLALVERTILQR
jgi:hypothetical protein